MDNVIVAVVVVNRKMLLKARPARIDRVQYIVGVSQCSAARSDRGQRKGVKTQRDGVTAQTKRACKRLLLARHGDCVIYVPTMMDKGVTRCLFEWTLFVSGELFETDGTDLISLLAVVNAPFHACRADMRDWLISVL